MPEKTHTTQEIQQNSYHFNGCQPVHICGVGFVALAQDFIAFFQVSVILLAGFINT